jgi:predicted glycoside hydrolase/deacetylase ChbG (UPF0249 family)
VTTRDSSPSTAERLGHPRDAKLLIVHADDLGFAHAQNAATLEGMDCGAVNSASVMITTPWVTEAERYALAHPHADLGVHLTLTSEWDAYRWGGVLPPDQVPTLYDPDGTFPRRAETVAERADPAEAERELRAQIDRAYALGLKPTHVDSHMGTVYRTPALFEVYAEIAREYRLPFLHTIDDYTPAHVEALQPGDVVADAVVMATVPGTREQRIAFYVDAIRGLRAGLTVMLVHLGFDDAELRAITVGWNAFGSAWRQMDYDALTSGEFRQAVSDDGVTLVTWRDVQRAMYSAP